MDTNTNQPTASQQSSQQTYQHFNFQPQTNQTQTNSLIKSKSTSDESTPATTTSNLDAFLESPQFLTDPYIKSLIDKGITLGIVWEVIKETLSRFLVTNINSTEFESNTINYSRLIDEEKFFEQLILHSIQVENTTNSKQGHSLANNDDYNENDDDDYESVSITNECTVGVEHPALANNTNEHDFDLGNSQFNRLTSLNYNNNNNNSDPKAVNRPVTANSNMMPVKKTLPLTAQQKLQQEQDFITQSINRINDKSNLRPIIVDSNDVALSSHSNKQVFMFSRIKQVVDYFEKRNHQIYVILSSWRKEQIMASTISGATAANGSATSSTSSLLNSQNSQSQQNAGNSVQPQSTQLTPDQLALMEMEQKNYIYYTPSKRVGAKRIVCDDDSYMLKLAVAKCAIIVSNDNFKRFLNHSDDFKLVIEERVLMYSFIDNTFMPAEDPLGKNGPSLDNFLRFESFVNQQYMKRCPYRKKCTYGSKCKFWHPERGLHQGNQLFKTAHQSVLDEAQEQKMRLEIILNKNSVHSSNNFLPNKIISNQQSVPQQQNIYNIESNNDLLDNDEDTAEESLKMLNRLKHQKQPYSGLITSANIYNLNEFETLKSNEQTWV